MLRICESRPRTYSSDWTMSVDQSKNTLTAAEPRPVVERMLTRAGNVLHRLFDRPGDRGHHFVGRHHAVVDEDHHPREVGLRKDRRGHRPGGIGSRQAQQDDRKQDRLAVPQYAPGLTLLRSQIVHGHPLAQNTAMILTGLALVAGAEACEIRGMVELTGR